MSHYLQFRSWLRTSSGSEKALASAAFVAVVGLTAWALVPTGGADGVATTQSLGVSPGSPAAGAAATSASTSGPGPTSSAGPRPAASVGAVTTSAGAPGASGSATSGGQVAGTGVAGAPVGGGAVAGGAKTGVVTSSRCGRLTNSDVGVTATTVKVAVSVLNLGGAIGNSAVGSATPQKQEQMANAVISDINAHGGAACRKIVPTFYEINPIDPSGAQNACLKIAQAGVFGVVDIGGFAFPQGAGDCIPQHKMPIVAVQGPVPSEARDYYPYYMTTNVDPTVDFKNLIYGLNQRGWFSSAQGFKKLGLLMDTCSPEVDKGVLDDLARVGIQQGSISNYTFSCPSGGFASPADMESAVIQHVRDHVTNVIVVTGGGSFKEYSNFAKQEGYKPKYTASNYQGFLITATGATGPDPGNFDGAVVTSTSKIGEDHSGLMDPGSANCIAIFKRHGLAASDVMSLQNGGVVCNQLLLFKDAADRAPALTRTQLVLGMPKIGKFAAAFPLADSIFNRVGKVSGGDFWWTIQFHSSCTCWKVLDPTLHPTFT